MPKFKPKTDQQIINEIDGHLQEARKGLTALMIRESMTIITCKEAKKKKRM